MGCFHKTTSKGCKKKKKTFLSSGNGCDGQDVNQRSILQESSGGKIGVDENKQWREKQNKT